MSKLKSRVIDTILIICSLFFIAIPMIHLFNNPEITIGQLFIKFWGEYLLSIVFAAGYVYKA